MITIRRSEDRGHANHGWLDTHFTFSFAEYHDPDFMGFGPLRVINQDRIAPRKGFPTHGHRDMEIVTYVLEGAVAHRDSMGNGSEIQPGEVQLMSAGTGVMHSEFNPRDEELHLLQMWVLPSAPGFEPRYEQKDFSGPEREGRLRLVVSPDGADGSLRIGQDARLHVGVFTSGQETEHVLGAGRDAWLHVATGRVKVNGADLGPGDGIAVQDEERLVLRASENSDVVLWDFAA